MTKYIAIIINVTFLTVGLLVNPVMAAERLEVYKMGESGRIISFSMTTGEIAVEEAMIAGLKTPKGKREVIEFELAESGETIEFPVKEDEIFGEGVARKSVEMEESSKKNPNS